jgi:MSHA biogenesis protein MshO
MKRQHGFTLVEMIIVMVLTGVVAAIVVMQLKPALQSYLAVARRANLVNQADVALRRIVTDVRVALPNSLNMAAAGQCMEMVPTRDGGRYRFAPDPVNPSNVFDAAATPIKFDVLTTSTATATGNLVVIGNASPAELYAGVNAASITVGAGTAGVSRSTITLAGGANIGAGSDGGRFSVIPATGQIVGYLCSVGTGKLLRTVRSIGDGQAACPVNGAAVVASKVSDCSFIYRENEGATQQSGYLQLSLGLTDEDETATLTMGAHVENVP